MKFKSHGIVWDAERNCILCKFKKGELITEDLRTIRILKGLDLEYEGEEPNQEINFVQDINKAHELAIKEDYLEYLNSKKVGELKDMAKEKGLEGYSNMKKDALIELIEGAE